jgi:small subunit ribosomal protein S20
LLGGNTKLANTASAKKRIRSSAKKRDRNRKYRSAARTYIKHAREMIETGDIPAAESWAGMAVQTLDKAAAKGILHRRNVDRRKSRLMKAVYAAKEASA